MNVIFKFLAGFSLCFFSLFVSSNESNHQESNITGIYSNMVYLDDFGDLVGIEIFLVNTEDGFYTVFQSAQGGSASIPVVVKTFIAGKKIEFTLPENIYFSGKFVGTIKKGKIVGFFEKGHLSTNDPGYKFIFYRKKSYWQKE